MGPGGEALWALQQQFEGVRVSVPPPEDVETRYVTLEGPREQVAAAAVLITRRLEEQERWSRGARGAG